MAEVQNIFGKNVTGKVGLDEDLSINGLLKLARLKAPGSKLPI